MQKETKNNFLKLKSLFLSYSDHQNMNQLPKELLDIIAGFLRYQDVFKLRLVVRFNHYPLLVKIFKTSYNMHEIMSTSIVMYLSSRINGRIPFQYSDNLIIQPMESLLQDYKREISNRKLYKKLYKKFESLMKN